MRPIILVICLCIAAGTATADAPHVISVGSLPGDSSVAAATGSQQAHAAARGGDHLLVVWSDQRGRAVGGSSVQGDGDVFGIRLDADGDAVDAGPFLVAGGMGLQDRPLVAWNGSAWLVVYRSQDPVGGYFETRLRAVRIAADGTRLDPTPLTLTPGAFTPDDIGLQVAGGDGQWLVTRCLYHGDGYGTYLAGQRVGPDGQLLDASPVMLQDWVYGRTVALWAGGGFLVAGPDWNDSDIIRARRVGAGGQPAGASFTIPGLGLATDGNEYYVTWVADFVNLVGSRLTTSGTLLTPAGAVLAEGYTQFHDCTLAHDGATWWLAWGAADEWRTVRVSAAGAVLDAGGGTLLPLVIGGTVNTAYAAQLAPRPGGGVHFLWHDQRPALGNDSNVFALPLAPTNAPGAERCVSTGTANQREPDLAAGPGGATAIVYVSEHANDDRVLLQLLAANGQAAGDPILVASGPTIGTAAVAWDGQRYMVAWDEGASGLTPTQIKARRLAADGAFIDTVPLAVMAGFDPDLEALDGDFLIAASRYAANPQFIDAWMRIVDGGTGAFAGSAARLHAGYVSVGPRVRSDGSRWLVTYHSHWSHSSAASDVVYNFVAPDGSFTPAVNPTTTSGGAGTPDVAFSGSAYLFVWRSNTLANADNHISGRLVAADGTFLTGDFTIAQATGRQLRPSVGWDGTEFLVVWDDQRNQESFYDGRTDIYGARVSAAGLVLDPSGFVVQASGEGDATAALLCRTGAPSRVAWTTFATDGAPYDSWRVQHALVRPAVLSPALPPAVSGALRQNVPNPFNPSTRIAFTLPRDGAASLAVYDLRGRLVRTLLDATTLAAGDHAVTWDGRADDGSAAAAGAYLYELRGPGVREVRRMTLAK
ncbi:MAG: hypothetical protein IPK64_01305 [bacterium]|nr:hypothetical protein [bacterium]